MSYPYSKFQELGSKGAPLDGELIIDAHTHIGGLSRIYHIPDGSASDMVAEMDRHGVSFSITFPFAGITSDFEHGNSQTAAVVASYPDRFIGFACVNPHYHTEMQDELERCKSIGLRGIKLIADYQRYPVEGPGLFPAYEFAHENSWIILSHNWGRPEFLDKLASTFNNACFIIGHYTSPMYSEVITKHENVFQCTCAAINFGDVENMLQFIPAEKVLYGSDFPDLPIGFSIGPILYARISDEEKRQILGLTAKSVLERWPGR